MTRPARIGLVGCGSQKRTERCEARDLYASVLFRLSARYADLAYDRWFVLSAKYGVLSPAEIVEPYERTLRAGDFHPWGSLVHARLCGLVPDATLFVLAGDRYVRPLAAFRKSLVAPLAGLGIGRRLQWLRREIDAIEAIAARVPCPPSEQTQ